MRFFLCILTLIYLVAAPGQATAKLGYSDGAGLLDHCEKMLLIADYGQSLSVADQRKASFCAGAVWALLSQNSTLKSQDKQFCPSLALSMADLIRDVVSHLRTNPQLLNKSHHNLIVQALADAHPCDKWYHQ